MKCKNCGHEIVQLCGGKKWYHTSTMKFRKNLPTIGNCSKHKSNGNICGCQVSKK